MSKVFFGLNIIIQSLYNSTFHFNANVSHSLSFFMIFTIMSWLTDHNLVASAGSNAGVEGSQRKQLLK